MSTRFVRRPTLNSKRNVFLMSNAITYHTCSKSVHLTFYTLVRNGSALYGYYIAHRNQMSEQYGTILMILIKYQIQHFQIKLKTIGPARIKSLNFKLQTATPDQSAV